MVTGELLRKDGFDCVCVSDCTAIPATLFESIVFDHACGTFTNAVRDEEGLLRQSDRGTAFFDEVGELPRFLRRLILTSGTQNDGCDDKPD